VEPLPALLDLATASLSSGDTNSLLKAAAARLGASLEARAVLIWLLSESGDELVCRARWGEPGAGFDPSPSPVTEGVLPGILEQEHAIAATDDEIDTEALTHLRDADRGRLKTALYAALPGPSGALGVVELLNRRTGAFTADDAAWLDEAVAILARSLDTLRSVEQDRQQHLSTIERLTQLYDLSRVFNSSLELEDLLPHIAERIADILHAEACNLWLLDPDAGNLHFAQRAGDDPTTSLDARIAVGSGLIGSVAKQGEARLIESPEDEPQLAERVAEAGEFRIRTLILAPLMKDEEVLGVIELINRSDGSRFDDDDLFFLTSIAEQAAIALKNANLLKAERKVRELDALLAISKEITSTLNLDKVLLTVVNQAGTVLPFERCSVGIFDRGRFDLAAVSGHEAVPKSADMASLRQTLEWLAQREGAVSANKAAAGWQVDPEAGRDLLTRHLDAAGFEGFLALPLRDEQGTLGVLALESHEPETLGPNQLELLNILASQTTVAIRNAQLYQQVPLINLMQPILERKARLQAMPRERLRQFGMRALMVGAALVVVPWRIRIGAGAQVMPAERRAVSAEVRGVIERVMVHEGDTVTSGTIVAELHAGENRVSLDRAQADLALAQHQFAEAEQHGDLAAAGQAQLRAEIALAEVALYRENVEKSHLRTSTDGIVITPKVEEKAGQLLEKGQTFCELAQGAQLAVSMNVPETSLDLVRPGGRVSLKLNAFPTRTLSARVERVGAEAVSIEGEQFFAVRALFVNAGHLARPGMVGRAKIVASGGWLPSWAPGWYPVGYALLRDPIRWAWRKGWTLLP